MSNLPIDWLFHLDTHLGARRQSRDGGLRDTVRCDRHRDGCRRHAIPAGRFAAVCHTGPIRRRTRQDVVSSHALGNLPWVGAHLTAMYWITQAGSALVLAPFDAVVPAWLVKRRQHDTAAFWAIAVVGAAIIDFAAKNMLARVRPSMWLSRMAETTYSFPSGHAMSTMAAVTALCVLLWPTRWRRPVLGVGALYVALVGTSRVYFGVHYPSDILAGWAASLAWVTGVKLLLDLRRQRAGGRVATSPKTV
jgi:membrane-associated phospholipid phosphatase